MIVLPPQLKRLKTPVQVQRWIDTLSYNKKDTMRTPPSVHRYREAHCLEGAMAAAAVLEPHGHPPLILDLDSADFLAHTLFIFQHKNKWGAVGMSRDIGLGGRKPVFRTIRQLVQSYVIPYIDEQARITSYGVLDLRDLPSDRWRHSKKNVWYVERALATIPHVKLTTPPSVIQKWRARYKAFKKLHPHSQPNYFPGSENWL